MSNDDKTVNILLDQLEKTHKLTSILTTGLVKVSIGILVAVTVVAVATIGSYFWSPDSYDYNIDNTNSTQLDSNTSIGGEDIDN
ncbi:hypothetical protein [Clostridium butyricum]|uniref:Uncharacterized protein n=1 Tax=Clostridium butyricum E4 str. BoNT E BL5262 TaxID=632245 RepID=C4IKR2_CLOBU|nr:hypothetical protein [Clostridium butyricum]APF22349.1 hypothetical protein NPD4_2654 [Clostridium butyricum]EDT75140.1 hypothetical protein CBY_3285 [Clostridium butyricum 5521]EEP53198.1 hypothetical protein CLP_1295 [Clostridium butyricum E4 str. BoNT E BL5262]NFL32912.1 hypothetical protein [Clostridium butyricum]NFS20272.1 hypothetical protein [Clostridium butyricum]